jgi:hypothetical protein
MVLEFLPSISPPNQDSIYGMAFYIWHIDV